MAPILRYCALALLIVVSALNAAQDRGQVLFGGQPVPGAVVTASSGAAKFETVTDDHGFYSFPDLHNGTWSIRVEMQLFEPLERNVIVGPGTTASASPAVWELKPLPLPQIQAIAIAPIPTASAPTPAQTGPVHQEAAKSARAAAEKPLTAEQQAALNGDQLGERASDGFLINGSTNNGASTPFALDAAFGNSRKKPGSIYNGMLGLIADNSVFDARSYSLTGQDTPKPAYNHLQAVAAFGGVIKIPHLIHDGPTFFVGYQWTRDKNASTLTGLMPDSSERGGALPQSAIDPVTGAPFPANQIPTSRISPQATALLNLYPSPNFSSNSRYNYQVPVVGGNNQDALQSRLNKTINPKNQLYGGFAFQSTRSSSPNLFDFLDDTQTLGLNANVNWQRRLMRGLYANFGVQYSRLSTRIIPYFENRTNVSGDAGITGNDQSPTTWGPPALTFASGISTLTDGLPAFNRNQTAGLSAAALWSRGRHNVTFGGDFRRLQFNDLSQQNPRGAFTFTGAATGGSDFADFLLGIPDTSSIAYGNADKYFRTASYDAYATDDIRIGPSLTINAGARWEYSSPITELYGRLVNLDIAPGFTGIAPVVASNPIGPITGERYSPSLLRPDRHAVEPRVGIAWRPINGSSLVIRSGFGMYYNTSVYQTIATQMAQQPPLSFTSSVQNTAALPLSLANGFHTSIGAPTNTFAVDPNFRVGYVNTWNLAVQRDLPGSLVVIATYLGSKGTRAMQEFLPNTYPIGATSPCPTCPTGFTYLTSNGNSTREAGQIELRRRLHNGFTATAEYTFAKAIDDGALGGRGQAANVIAQNWLDLSAERGLSTFDQRHVASITAQYTTGMGLGGGSLLGGWRGALLKEWTLVSTINASSGTPLTPLYLAAVAGTGVTSSIRPEYTGAPLYTAPNGFSLNPNAYVAPFPGQWGNAGRDSITGPSQFSWNTSLGRTFRTGDRYTLDLRIDATNVLNHVTYTAWDTTINSAQFGLPVAANAMRSFQTTLRIRF